MGDSLVFIGLFFAAIYQIGLPSKSTDPGANWRIIISLDRRLVVGIAVIRGQGSPVIVGGQGNRLGGLVGQVLAPFCEIHALYAARPRKPISEIEFQDVHLSGFDFRKRIYGYLP